MNKTLQKFLFLIISLILLTNSGLQAKELKTKLSDILSNPKQFEGKKVNVTGFFSIWKNAPGAPPISRSDWVLCDEHKKGIYCNGVMPSDEETGEIEKYWQPLDVLAEVAIRDGKPYLSVINSKAIKLNIEKMVSVREIILNQQEMEGKHVGIMGVLAKGYGIKGDRMYLIADPTGAIRLGKTKKLYPKGTILHINGYVTFDEYNMPMIDNVEVISSKID